MMKVTVGNITVSIDKKLVGVPSDIEYFDASKPDRVYGYVKQTFDEYYKEHQKRIQVFDRNRRAYNGIDADMWGGQAQVKADPATGLSETFQSTLMADKIDDAAGLALAGSPRIYPMVVVDEDAFRREDAIQPDENGKNVGGLNLERTLQMKPQEIVTRYVEAAVNDLMERENFTDLYIKLGVDSRLESLATTYQFIEHNHETGQDDVKSLLIDNRDIMFFPRNARRTQDVKGVFITTYPTVWELRKLYPKDAKDIIETQSSDTGSATGQPHDEKGQTARYKGTVRVVQFFVWDDTPDGDTGDLKYPNGRLIRFSPDLSLLFEDRAADKLDYFPLAAFIPKPVSHSIYGRCVGTPLRGMQAYHTQLWQQWLINVRTCASGKLINVDGNLVNPDEYSDMPGEMITVRSLAMIQRIGASPIGQEILLAIEKLEERADRITGASEAAVGQAPTSNASGRQILSLQAGTAQVLAPMRMLFRIYMLRQWKQILDLMKISYKKGRYIRVRSEDGIPPVIPFDFDKVILSIDCEMGEESLFPTSPSAKLQLAEMLMNMKDELGVPLAGGEFLFQFMKMPDERGLKADYEKRRAQAMQNAQVRQGAQGQGAPQPNAAIGGSSDGSPTQGAPALSQNEVQTAAANPTAPGQ